MSLLLTAKDHVVEVADNASQRVKDTFSSVATTVTVKKDAAVDTVASVGTRATDAAIRGVLAVDKTLHVSQGAAVVDSKLGISEKASAAANSLDAKFALTERYARALEQVCDDCHAM